MYLVPIADSKYELDGLSRSLLYIKSGKLPFRKDNAHSFDAGKQILVNYVKRKGERQNGAQPLSSTWRYSACANEWLFANLIIIGVQIPLSKPLRTI